MKRCTNPDCESSFLFGEDKTVCPFCHSVLTDSNAAQQPFLMPADRIQQAEPAGNRAERFVQENLNNMECHGRIVEIDHQELFYSKRLKLFNALFRGEPYQFAHQTIEYTIRVENITDSVPTEVKDFCLYGSYLGRMQVGDEVVIKAKNKKNRRVVKSIYNRTTESVVKPGLQIPAAFFRAVFAILALIIITFICRIVRMFQSGEVSDMLTAVLAIVVPVAIIIWLLWSVLKCMFGR